MFFERCSEKAVCNSRKRRSIKKPRVGSQEFGTHNPAAPGK
jgi:hypothetical protein